MDTMRTQMGMVLSTTMVRLVVAAILGGLIGLERQLHRKPAGLRTNMFICFGAAMFTVLSDKLAGSLGGDHTRIAAQIIPGIGFIGAGSILHARGSVVGLTTRRRFSWWRRLEWLPAAAFISPQFLQPL